MILDYESKENKMIDIFVEDRESSLKSYLFGAKRVKETYEALSFSVTRYTPYESKNVKQIIPADIVKKIRCEQREKLFESFVGNKYFDAPLVEKMLSFENETCVMNLRLALGDISDAGFYEGRLAYVYNQMVIELGEEESEARRIVECQLEELEKIVNYAKRGYTLRFWCSYNNEELCSLYYLMNTLRDVDCPIILLNLPQRIRKANGRFINKLRKWAQLSPEQIGFAISQSNPHFITKDEKERYAQLWDRLKEENGNIRITKDGAVESKPIDYYFGMIELNFPLNKIFKLTRLLSLIYKNEKQRNLDFFPYYFWSTQFRIMMERGILRKVKDVENDRWGYNCWVEVGEAPSKTISREVGDLRYDYVEKRLRQFGCNMITILDAICDDNIERSYKLLIENPNITKEEFFSIMEIEEYTFDKSDHNLRIYKYTYCKKCSQLVDKMDYREKKYCRYCENPFEETFDIIGAIYEKSKFVMNYLLERNVDDELIKLAIADRNLNRSYQIIEENPNITAEQFIKDAGYCISNL